MHPQDIYPPVPQPGKNLKSRMANPNPYDPLFLYKVGLAVIGLFTLVILLFVLVGAGAVKQDAKTEKAANKIATKLDTYITINSKIPDSLAVAGVHEDTSHITYTKLSSTSYKFCITYKQASDSSVSPADVLTGQAVYKRLAASYSSGDNSYLYISSIHKKGENCQTVKPSIGGYSSYDSSSSGDQSYTNTTTLPTSDDPEANAKDAAKTDSICYLSGYQTHYSGTITAVTDANGNQSAGTVDANGDDIKLKIKPDGASPAGEQTFTVKSSDTSTFSNGCISMYGSSYKSGDHVAIFTQNKDSFMPDVIVDYSAE